MKLIRVYLPDTFTQDASECDPDMWELWEKILAQPTVRRGRGTGRWVELSPDEAREVKKEADYREEYWLTDSYGPTEVDYAAGRAAQRVAATLKEALT